MEEDEEKSDDSSDHHGSVEDCKSSTEVAYEPDIWGTPYRSIDSGQCVPDRLSGTDTVSALEGRNEGLLAGA